MRKIYAACCRITFRRLYLLLHSYELLALLWIAIFVFSLPNIWKAVAIGLTQHLIFDQIANPINTLGYFLSYRIAKRFDKYAILKEERPPCR